MSLEFYSTNDGFLGVYFSRYDLETATNEIVCEDFNSPFRYVVTPNVQHMVSLLESKKQLGDAVENAWRVYCDSRVLSRLARLCGQLLSVVPGSDLTERVMAAADAKGLKVLLIGPTESAARRLLRRYSNLTIVTYTPPMGFLNSKAEVDACIAAVEREQAQLVFLAVGAPRQELLAHMIASRGTATGIGLCVGASIDFLTGIQRRAPIWMQRAGCEWLYRLLSDPRRLAARYLIECPKIFYLMLRRQTGRKHARDAR